MALQNLINKRDTFEIVRDKIAQILANEVANQMALATAAAEDPALWDLDIYLERANPWEKWLNDVSPDNFVPVVNVWFDSDAFDKANGNVVFSQAAEGTFNIDCYGFGISQDDGGTGHIAGDEAAAKESHRAARLVRNILMASENIYLELPQLVTRRWVQVRTSFQPQQDVRSVQRIVATRVALEVKYLELAPQYEGVALECIHAEIKRNSDGVVLAEMEYLDGCVVPLECDCTPTMLSDMYWLGGNIWWSDPNQWWYDQHGARPDTQFYTAIGGWNTPEFRPSQLKICAFVQPSEFNQLPSTFDVTAFDEDNNILGITMGVVELQGQENVISVTVALDWSSTPVGLGFSRFELDPDLYIDGPNITCIEFV